jgi:hypothetical protein
MGLIPDRQAHTIPRNYARRLYEKYLLIKDSGSETAWDIFIKNLSDAIICFSNSH